MDKNLLTDWCYSAFPLMWTSTSTMTRTAKLCQALGSYRRKDAAQPPPQIYTQTPVAKRSDSVTSSMPVHTQPVSFS